MNVPERGGIQRPLISVAIPCRNEEANVREITAAVAGQLEPLGVDWEIILIDNESTDRTVELARALCAGDHRIKLIVNARNFGQMRSPTHAIFAGRGDAVIGMCADFQDPPDLLPKFIERWRTGVPIVLGVRESEKTLWWKGLFGRIYYDFVARFADVPAIPNATGFGLYDRKVVDLIRGLNEPEPYYRGLLVETGHAIEVIEYARPLRRGGKSNNNFFNLVEFALSGLTSSSKKLLRLPFFVGAVGMVTAGLLAIAALAALLLGGPAGLLGLAALVQMNFGLLFLFLGLFGDQLRLMSERQRGFPLVVERERLNFDD
jgi:glycosyltransferase involved in cell wall biosynthesis